MSEEYSKMTKASFEKWAEKHGWFRFQAAEDGTKSSYSTPFGLAVCARFQGTRVTAVVPMFQYILSDISTKVAELRVTD